MIMKDRVQLNHGKNGEREVCEMSTYADKTNDVFYSIDDAVNKVGFGKFQKILLFLAGLGWFSDSAEIFVLSMIGDFIACDWKIYRWQVALLISVVFAGIMIGSPILGAVADIYGRKKAISVAITMLFLFGAISAASPSIIWMVIFRTCMGIGLSAMAQGVTLCSEYSPSYIRGRIVFYLNLFWCLGSFSIVLIAWLVMKYFNSWRILLAAASIPSFISLLLVKWYPESVRFYLVSNQYKRATKILHKMANANGTDLPTGKLLEVPTNHKRGRISDLLGKKYRFTTFLIWYIWLATAFTYFGVAFISPIIVKKGYLIGDEGNGTDTVTNDMTTIVTCAQFSEQFYIDLLWTSAAEFPGTIAFTILIEYMDRKVLLGGSCFLSGVFILLLLIKTNKIITLLFLFGARAVISAQAQLQYLMTTEIFPTTFRSLAMGTGTSFCRLGGMIVPYVAQVLIIDHPILAICLLSGVVFLCGIAGALLPVETRGTNMKDVPVIDE